MSHPKTLSAPVPPGGTIGILGGGQLGRMLALAAARLGLKTHIYSDEENAPAFQVCTSHTVGRYDDEAALTKFAKHCDAITYEFENVPSAAAALLSELKPTNPNARALAVAQDRLEEKNFVRQLGLKTADFVAVDSSETARNAFAMLGNTNAILKTCRLGYDGKGQMKVASAEETAVGFETFACPSLLESFVDFAFEASIIAARGMSGEFAAYDPPENFHEHHILRRSTVPARLSPAQCDEAKDIARRMMDGLGYIGVLAVELFVTKEGALLVNEFAPRVHNSGHWTLEACAVSQFEQHIRAIAGWPLGDPARHSDAVMENIIGEEAADWQALAARGGALHLYGKSEIRPMRKMGHITHLKPKTGAH
ncbi:MAG TPA: 5-(carboxyamino)imidazole ribonucleotide synthase [Rhizomicrobium sp.]|nr:5-(carboxyamino)imidazole ribonucleotide synthase [Rhizomicrobium sp.]